MPIFEYYCSKNHRIYQFYARSQALATKVPRCPDGGDEPMVKRVSQFAVLTGAEQEDPGDLFLGMNEAQMQRAMEELQHDYERLESDSTQPDALSHLMKKIHGFLGDRASPELKELIDRLDRGEDPVELEQLFGDVESERDLFTALRQRLGQKLPPSRDPKLYELRDYLD